MDEKLREELNHQAYLDVLDMEYPTYPGVDYYMECYKFWSSLRDEPDEQHIF